MLYNVNLASMAIGCILKNPSLLFNPSYPLAKSDFSPEPFHRIVFVAAVRLAESGAQNITEVELDNYLKDYESQYEIFQDSNGFEFVTTVRELASLDSYELYYNAVRKFSLLRELKENGYDISEYYDEMLDETEQNAKLNKWTIKEILDDIEIKGNKLRNKFDVNFVRDEITVGEDVDSLLEDFKNQPSFGALLTSPLLTQLIHGFSRGNFILRSAPSGTNKTRIAVADLCGLCVDKYWDFEAQDFIDNPNYQGPGFFIHAELDTRREMQPMFLACISGVPTNKITMGQWTDEEELRIKRAAEIIHDNHLILTAMPDFTSASIERKIKENVEQYGAAFGVFDYMMLNGPLSMEYKQNTGVQAREDMALRGLATDLKEYCEKYNIGIISSTQTNGNEKLSDFPDETCIAGSRAMRNKVDAGFVMLSAKDRPKEMKLVEQYIHRKGFGESRTPVPNRITYLYKARFGEYSDQKIKVFHYFDPAIMRNTDFFCCDAYNNLVNIPKPSYIDS